MPRHASLRFLALILLCLGAVTVGAPALAHGTRPHPAPPQASQTKALENAPPVAAAAARNGAPEVAMAVGMTMDEESPWPKTIFGRVLTWLGMWHVAVVHFPIALFVIVAVVEAAARFARKPEWTGSDRLLVAIAALSTVAAVALGWLSMGPDLAKDDFVHRAHRYLGTGLAALALLTWWAKERAYKRPGPSTRATYFPLLGLTIIAVLANAFFGGSIVHGGMGHLLFK